MNKLFLLSWVFILNALGISAQSEFQVTPSFQQDSIYDEVLDDYYRMATEMSNLSDETLEINWKIVSINVPDEWNLVISDIHLDIIVNSAFLAAGGGTSAPLEFLANTSAPFNISVHPNDVNGCADVMIEIENDNTGFVYDTVVYEILVNGCGIVSNSAPEEQLNKIVVYPNPVREVLSVQAPSRPQHFEVVDAQGRIVYAQVEEGLFTLNLGALAAGVYVIRAIDDNQRVWSQRFIKL